ncbi:HAD family hydrolase [Oceanobacillus chungangensis]|uniref:HAD family hydrolase n=1 Tax=Oceanobacillus chungangensis TaxID=1229152 RepID=A0A3D8PJM1_9BACI|nr:HAD family hydrolase [Oceanobacillus chungangensis]RDW15429.1 HAD family hydrolase [Oceanobacillus chungangensis]
MDSIIFDLDGTLWDSVDTVVDAWNNVLTQNKQINREITKDDLRQVMGLPFDKLGEKLLPELEKETRAEIIHACCNIENRYLAKQGGILYENVEHTLKMLSKKFKLFIVSNCQDGYIEAFYHYHGLEKYFIDYENPGRTGLSKGENIKLIMERNQLASPVYVGDTDGDQQAAREAGIPFIFAAYGFGEVIDYEYSIDQFEVLADTMKEIESKAVSQCES